MKISYNWLKDYIKGKMPGPEKTAELLTMHAFEVKSIEKREDDWLLDVDVTANRACDCLSYLGIAREIAAITGNVFRRPEINYKESKVLKTKDFIKLDIKNSSDCPRYIAGIIFDVKIGPSPQWIQQRLKICGLQPINNIVDMANYVMLETGQPLHTFDLDKIKGKIVVRKAKKGEKIEALDGKTYNLDKDILVIADKENPIAIAGIKGGSTTGIDSETKNILIEAANFDQKLIRKGSQKLKLKTDASWRFENGIDPNLALFGQRRLLFLIQKIVGGYPGKGLVDFYPKKVLPKKIKFDLGYLERLLGIKIPKRRILKILKDLGFKVDKKEIKKKLLVQVPTERLDVLIQEDLIEEVGRIFGYHNIPSVFPQTLLIPPERNNEVSWRRMCKDILKERGFTEVYNYSFIGDKEKETFKLQKKALLEIQNPMSVFDKYLRPSLVPSLLKNAKENLKNFDRIKIFESGRIFLKCYGEKTQKPFKEKEMISGLLAEKKGGDELFYELKGSIESLINKMGIGNIWYDSYKATPENSQISLWHPQKSAEIKIDNQEVGFIGEIHPGITEGAGIKEKVFVFDIDFEKLTELASEEHEYRPISFYPAAVRDLAILIPQEIKVAEVLNKINTIGGKLVRDVDLFDIYEGDELPRGKKNLAFHIIYQAEDHTLSAKEISGIHNKIVKILEEDPEWEVRK